MAEHILKCWTVYWDAIASGAKNFEVRRDDRGFQKGDTVVLRKTDPKSGHYEMDYSEGKPGPGFGKPKAITRTISYVLTGGQFGIEPGYVVLALAQAQEKEK